MRAVMLMLLAGCFGAGPDPGTASKAQILFTLPVHPLKQDNCMPGRYIGDVAIGGGDVGYVVTHTFIPSCGGGGGSGPSELLSSEVHQFKKQGGATMKIGDAGMTSDSGASKPRIGANASDAVWFYGDPQSANVHMRSQTATISGDYTFTNASVPASVIVDANKTYLALWTTPSGANGILGPRFPCCGPSNNSAQSYNLLQFTNANPAVQSGVGTTPKFEPSQVKEALVANTANLIYFDSTPGPIAIRGQPKTGGSQFDIDMLPVGGSAGGLAADDQHVAWVNTVSFAANQNRNLCEITVANATPPFDPVKLISTTKWSCTDVAIDGGTAYFPIVDVFDGESDPVIINRGIGAIDLATKNFGSIELGISGPELGPRQVFVDGDGLIVVAPFAIARIAKSEINGKREISD